jgi:2'-5' RNA ligase
MLTRDAVEAQTKASWVRTDRMHLTLLFLGNVEEAVEQHVRSVLACPIRETPFDVTFDGLGFFPDRGSPRVLWLGVREGLEHLRSVHRTVATRVGFDVSRDLQATPQQPPFTPHLTLARLRDRVPRGKLAGITRIRASAGPSRIDRVTLYESRLSQAGPTYVPLAVALLQP